MYSRMIAVCFAWFTDSSSEPNCKTHSMPDFLCKTFSWSLGPGFSPAISDNRKFCCSSGVFSKCAKTAGRFDVDAFPAIFYNSFERICENQKQYCPRPILPAVMQILKLVLFPPNPYVDDPNGFTSFSSWNVTCCWMRWSQLVIFSAVVITHT